MALKSDSFVNYSINLFVSEISGKKGKFPFSFPSYADVHCISIQSKIQIYSGYGQISQIKSVNSHIGEAKL